MSDKPGIGRIVHYRLTARDADHINKRRDDSKRHFADNSGDAPGWIAHVGNHLNEADVFPMIIVNVWEGGKINGQVHLDGNDVFWATGKVEGHKNGQWTWPVRS